MKTLLFNFLISLSIFIISSLPLYFSVKFFNGKVGFIKTLFVSFLIGIIVSAINLKFKLFGGLISFLITIWLYHEIFRLKWHKAFLVWILQLIFIFIIYMIIFFLFVILLGINILLI